MSTHVAAAVYNQGLQAIVMGSDCQVSHYRGTRRVFKEHNGGKFLIGQDWVLGYNGCFGNGDEMYPIVKKFKKDLKKKPEMVSEAIQKGIFPEVKRINQWIRKREGESEMLEFVLGTNREGIGHYTIDSKGEVTRNMNDKPYFATGTGEDYALAHFEEAAYRSENISLPDAVERVWHSIKRAGRSFDSGEHPRVVVVGEQYVLPFEKMIKEEERRWDEAMVQMIIATVAKKELSVPSKYEQKELFGKE